MSSVKSSCHVYYSPKYPRGVVYFCVYCEHSTHTDSAIDCIAVISDRTGILYRSHAICQHVYDSEEFAQKTALLFSKYPHLQPRYILRRQKLFSKPSMSNE